jgi:hypothetical protein
LGELKGYRHFTWRKTESAAEQVAQELRASGKLVIVRKQGKYPGSGFTWNIWVKD